MDRDRSEAQNELTRPEEEARPMRRIGSLALMLAVLMIPATFTTVRAAASCAGEPATIETGSGGQLILGTPGRDVIVSKGGDDKIFGRGGGDLICAGAGDDKVNGGGGADRILGGQGDDTLAGARGNDAINGGRHSDRCTQGAGSGQMRRCERADMSVDFTMVDQFEEQLPINVDIAVENNGPDRASYTILIENSSSLGASCDFGVDSGAYPQPPLDVDAKRTFDYSFTCTVVGLLPSASVEVTVVAHAKDPNNANHHVTETVQILPGS
jgi:RTX calcium-binding nonapeptide repeat (4 copies)